MTALSFTLDPAKAKEAGQSQRINETGAYTGKFTQARQIVARSGSIGIELAFESVAGQTADRLSVYVQGSDGRELAGSKMIHALMTCMSMRNLASANGQAEVYNSATQKREMQPAVLFPDLCNKPIGLVLQVEEYAKDDGGVGESMKLVMPFNASSKQTAREVLEQKPAEDIEKLLHTIQPVIKARRSGGGSGSHTTGGSAASSAPSAVGFDDDIPF